MNRFIVGFVAGYILMRLCNDAWNNGYETALELVNNTNKK